ncbi:MAG: sulfite exporter TauE/SafE family protein [Chloroflexi bacterium]|nr:sulfite exporter TauE/SafE family protein [Chloroflexota bacterium]
MDSFALAGAGLIVIFLAGMMQGITGFGFALVAVPIMVALLPPKEVVPVVLIHSALINIFILFKVREWVDLKRIIPLMIAGVVATPLGTYLLIMLDVQLLKVLIGVVIAVSAVALLRGFRVEIRNERLAFGPVGLISGILSGATQMSGPPVALFFTNQGLAKHVFRANLVAYFMVLNVATVPSAVVGGLMTEQVLSYAALFLPAMVLGAIAGMVLAHRVEEDLFRKLALNMVTVAGFFSVVSGLGLS